MIFGLSAIEEWFHNDIELVELFSTTMNSVSRRNAHRLRNVVYSQHADSIKAMVSITLMILGTFVQKTGTSAWPIIIASGQKKCAPSRCTFSH